MFKRGDAYVRARPELLQVAPVEWALCERRELHFHASSPRRRWRRLGALGLAVASAHLTNASITYDKSVNDVVWRDAVHHDRRTVIVKRHGKIVHSEDIEHTLRNLDEEVWSKLGAQEGLTITKVRKVKTLRLYYYLEKA
ncbi:MAG: hypothetical protein Q9195_006084 [Heterodermia aff. obscurata]